MVAKKARRGTEEETFGGLLGTFWEAFWEHFGDLLGTFWGSGARLEENALLKGGVIIPSRRFWLIFEKKMKILRPEKGSQIGPKMAPKKVGKKDTSKSEIFTFFLINLMKMLYFPIENGPRGPILLYFTMNSRVRKGRKIEANVAKTLEKQ